MLALKTLLLKLLTKAIKTDGTSDGWRIRQYANGRMEAWRSVTLSGVAIGTAVGSLYQTASSLSVNLPKAFRFTSVNQCQLTVNQSSYSVWPCLYNVDTTKVDYRLLSCLSRTSTSTNVLHIYVEGAWK